MAFKPFYSDENEIPSALKAHYALDEASGNWLLQVEPSGGYALENVAGLKSTLGKLKTRAEKAEEALKPYQALELAPEALSSALTELGTLKGKPGTPSEREKALQTELETLQKAHAGELEKAVAPLRTKLQARTEQLQKVTIDGVLASAITAHGGKAKGLTPYLKDFIKVSEAETGELVVSVVDGEGNQRVRGADLKPLSIEDLVLEAKADPELAGHWNATDSSGSGSERSHQSGGGGMTPDKIGTLSMDEYRKGRAAGTIT